MAAEEELMENTEIRKGEGKGDGHQNVRAKA